MRKANGYNGENPVRNVYTFYLESERAASGWLQGKGERGTGRRKISWTKGQIHSPELDVLDGIGKRLVPFLLVLRVYERVELNDALGILFEDVFRTIFKTRRVLPDVEQRIKYNKTRYRMKKNK